MSGKKLAGILLERNGDRVAVGFGVNLAEAPQLPDRDAASLGGKILPQAFAPLLAGSFARLLDLWRQSDRLCLLRRGWRARTLSEPRSLSIRVATHLLPAVSTGIEPDGALRLRRDDGSLDIVRAGDVAIDRVARLVAVWLRWYGAVRFATELKRWTDALVIARPASSRDAAPVLPAGKLLLKGIRDAIHHYQRRHRDFLQGLGPEGRPADRLPSWLAAQRATTGTRR